MHLGGILGAKIKCKHDGEKRCKTERDKRRFYDSSRRESWNSCLVSYSFMCSPCGGSGPVSHIGPCYFRAKRDVMSARGRHNTPSVTTAEWFQEQMHQQGAPCEDDEQKWNGSRRVAAVVAEQRCHAMGGLKRAGCSSWAGQCKFLYSSAFPLNTDTRSKEKKQSNSLRKLSFRCWSSRTFRGKCPWLHLRLRQQKRWNIHIFDEN